MELVYVCLLSFITVGQTTKKIKERYASLVVLPPLVLGYDELYETEPAALRNPASQEYHLNPKIENNERTGRLSQDNAWSTPQEKAGQGLPKGQYVAPKKGENLLYDQGLAD